jgi:ABC-type transport system involved in multi-copper enzyme maturation permease subunit
MTVLPVIGRELRTQARMAFTYNLRVIGGLAVLAIWMLYSIDRPWIQARGGELFAKLNCAVFISIWVLTPLLCADCISRERREGTIGLLFLTPLKARDVVLAKGMIHGLRAFSVLLAALPVATMAFLFGGVSKTDAVTSSMVNLSAICWALAAGLLASSMSRTWVRSQLLAAMFAAGFGYVFLMGTGWNLAWQLNFRIRMPYATQTMADQMLQIGVFGVSDWDGWWDRVMAGLPPAGQRLWMVAQARMLVSSVLFLWLSVELAAGNLRRFWREEPPTARRVWLEKKLLTPVVMVSFFHRWMRRKLERNPIGWLEQRAWSGRMVTWGWFAVMISIFTAAIRQNDEIRALNQFEVFMAWLLLGVMAVTAAGSFRRERETGVLELLLVSPMSEGQIIGGRLRGLWGQFLPALIALLGIWAYLSGLYPGTKADPGMVQFFCNSFVTLPVIGLYYSLRRSNFISSFLFTAFMGAALPWGVALGCSAMMEIDTAYSVAMLTQWGVAIVLGRRLYIDMKRRNFPLTRAIT